MRICVKDTPKIARQVSDVKVNGNSVEGCVLADTDEGYATTSRGITVHGRVSIFVWGKGSEPTEHRLIDDAIVGYGKDSDIDWSKTRNR